MLAVSSSYLNLNQIKTHGYDFEAEYGFDLGSVRPAWDGNVTLRATANYVPSYRVTTRSGSVEQAGDLNVFQLPEWTGYASVAYSVGDWNLLLDGNYIGGGNYANAQIGLLQNNGISGIWYMNTAIQRQLHFGGRKSLLYLNVDNILDEEPPYSYGVGGGINGGPAYDRKGTRFKLGYRMEF